MTPLADIRILIEPNPSQRQFGQYDRFARELQAQTAARVAIVECPLEEAPRGGILLIAYRIGMRKRLPKPVDAPSAREPQPILLDVSYSEALSLSELVRPAAIVIGDRFARWKLGQEERIFRQVYGLKSLAPSLTPLLEPGPLSESEHYYLYESPQVAALPAVLNLYIDAYWQSLPHARI
jgi:hypothetical protein